MFTIPEELVGLAGQRRLIPFVGAGFSAALGLPSWEDMLKGVCEGVEDGLSFAELKDLTRGDLLQMAEYLYLKHDRQIGPIRHRIERAFAGSAIEPIESGAHVELVNLGAGQIYTTNYDDAIEQTYKALGLSYTPVILPKDVALADTERTQVVKYHGDLAHERTLVLTESAYYQRLDFESPMDLKFRSDLLGKSVLFMGYSFRDINIRIIWFKLMQMMRDIPEADRRPSYIVRIEPNPALEELYAAVGLKTIVLDPEGEASTDAERSALVGRFLLQLSARAATTSLNKGAPRAQKVYVSSAAIEHATARIKEMRTHFGPVRGMSMRFGGLINFDDPVVRRLFEGVVPHPLQSRWNECVTNLLPHIGGDPLVVGVLDRLAPSAELTQYIVEVLASNGNTWMRGTKQQLVAQPSLWPKAWRFDIDSQQAAEVLGTFAGEIQYQAREGADEDIAYLAELAARIRDGSLVSKEPAPELRERAEDLLLAASQIYPSVAQLKPTKSGPPDVAAVLEEVSARAENFEPLEVDLRTMRRVNDRRSAARSRAPQVRP